MSRRKRLEKRIKELEADRVRLLKDDLYYHTEKLKRQIYEDVMRAYWFGGEPVGEVKGFTGIWQAITK